MIATLEHPRRARRTGVHWSFRVRFAYEACAPSIGICATSWYFVALSYRYLGSGTMLEVPLARSQHHRGALRDEFERLYAMIGVSQITAQYGSALDSG